jgi:hypothetical protein
MEKRLLAFWAVDEKYAICYIELPRLSRQSAIGDQRV